MRVNVYEEELTDRFEVAESKDGRFVGIRFFLELPATVNGKQYRGPFLHRPDDDDSSSVTFWSKDKAKLLEALRGAITKPGIIRLSDPRVRVSGISASAGPRGRYLHAK